MILHFMEMKRIYIFVLSTLFLGCIILSIAIKHHEQESQIIIAQTGQRLTLTATLDYGVATYYSAEDLDNHCNGLEYHHLSEVMINLEDKVIKLDDAIKDGRITTEEIIAFSRIDSKNGYCRETYESKNGLCSFTYRYPTYELYVIYDVYETPDGEQHLIDSLSVCGPGSSAALRHSYRDENGHLIDKEDWGLSFNILDSTSNTLSLFCTQSGGQHLGELIVTGTIVYDSNTKEILESSIVASTEEITEKINIANNTDTCLIIDLCQSEKKLIAGDYTLQIWVTDEYDPSTIHPLMRDYYDTQVYSIEFNIP